MPVGFPKNDLYELMWSRPSFAQLELTRNCNQSCLFCFDGCESKRTYVDLPLDKWIAIIDQLHMIGVQTLHFSGGEDFLYPEFIELLRYSKLKGFHTHVNTNGSIDITESIPYVDEYVFSVHGTGSVHDAIVRKDGSFASVLSNIAKANASGKTIQLSTVLVKENFRMVEELFLFFEARFSIEKYAFTLAAVSLSGKAFENHAVAFTQERFTYYLQELDKVGREKLVLKHGLYCLYDYDIQSEKPTFLHMPVCAAGKDKIIVKYNGDVYPCNYFQTDAFYCGNMLQQSVFEIWKNGVGYRPFRALISENQLTEECSDCHKRPKCFGGCRIWTAGFMNRGEFTNERDQRCELGNAFAGAGDNL